MSKEANHYGLVEGLKELLSFKPLVKKDMTPLLVLLFCQVFGIVVGLVLGAINATSIKPLMFIFTIFL
jgi:hypothetical protein